MKSFFKTKIVKYDWNWAFKSSNPFYFEIRQQKRWGPFTWWTYYDTVYGSDTAYELTRELNRKLEN